MNVRTGTVVAAIAALALVVAACGSSAPSTTTTRSLAAGQGAPTDTSCAGGVSALADWVVGFERDLSEADAGALRHLTSGRFGWFSVDDWRHGPGNGNIVAYKPRKLLAFIRARHGLPVHFRTVAFSLHQAARHVDFYYWGTVRGTGVDRGRQFVGKAALNCDRTLRVWSMTIRMPGSDLPAPRCSTPPGDQVEGFAVCNDAQGLVLDRTGSNAA
ncbi:MAG: hypothetical protein JSS68_14110 [Actinobacteria bacterium]|nr:hypothetical protein [Actinomycetota bacterium]MBS1884337.1 hypothetical protein [Actinomycetota bacterium]